MTATIAALEQKLNPADLREKAVHEPHHVEDRVKEAVKEQVHEASLALRQELANAKEGVEADLKIAFQNAKQSMRDATKHAQEMARQVASGARSGARRVEHVINETLHERPMVLGAVALAVGAAIGLSLPRSEREDALMGEARDQLLHKAQGVTGDAAHAVQELTAKTAETAKQATAGSRQPRKRVNLGARVRPAPSRHPGAGPLHCLRSARRAAEAQRIRNAMGRLAKPLSPACHCVSMPQRCPERYSSSSRGGGPAGLLAGASPGPDGPPWPGPYPWLSS